MRCKAELYSTLPRFAIRLQPFGERFHARRCPNVPANLGGNAVNPEKPATAPTAALVLMKSRLVLFMV